MNTHEVCHPERSEGSHNRSVQGVCLERFFAPLRMTTMEGA